MLDSPQLSWTHLRSLMALNNSVARQFYMEMCRLEHWSTRTLDEKIDAQLFERTAISRKPDEIIKAELDKVKEKNELQPDMVFRSSYFLDMLGLPDVFSESDLETAILIKSNISLKSSALISHLSTARNASLLTEWIIGSTCCFTIGDCADWWQLTLSSENSSRHTRGRCCCISAILTAMTGKRARLRQSV